KAPGAGYPLYGRVEAAPPDPLAALLAGGGAVVQREALERLGIRVGDRLTLGAATFTVRGIVEREPDRSASLVTLGPRVFVAGDALERTGLVQVGSRVRYRALVRLPAPLAARDAREAMARRIADPGVRVASYDEAQPGLRRFFSQLASYLGLVGLASLLVGGIGVASSVATFVRRQAPTIAILKALGADSRTVLATFLWQTLTVGAAASVAGAVLGTALQPVLIRLLAGLVPFTLEARVLVGAARRLPRAPWPAWRHGLGGLRRPGGHPALVVVALGAGVMLLVAVALLQDSLDAQIDHERRREAPSFFFVDVQPDRREAFARVLARTGGGVTPALTPIVRARLAAVNGVRVTRDLV